ncbi:MAG: uroporphyrinogen decarboxylase family protein [Eubacteriales bacterium]
MTPRENALKAIHFDIPDYIPASVRINDSCWHAYPQEFLLEQIEKHPLLFSTQKLPTTLPYTPSYKLVAQKDIPYIDDWGCTWYTSTNGITGTVVKHPLTDWSDLEHFYAPDPKCCTGIGDINWTAESQRLSLLKKSGQLAIGGLRHGHTFLQLCDIRGYENLIFDMVDEMPELWTLIDMIEQFNLEIVKKYLSMDIDVISFAEDLGMQSGPMLSPNHFRQYIRPSYKRLMQPVKNKNKLIHMHSDGDIRLLIDDIIDSGVGIITLQDLVNGIDWIKEHLAGKLCIELDIDRQAITPYSTPTVIHQLIKDEVTKLGTKQGGLMLIYGLYPGLPLENVKAVMDAMEMYAQWYNYM